MWTSTVESHCALTVEGRVPLSIASESFNAELFTVTLHIFAFSHFRFVTAMSAGTDWTELNQPLLSAAGITAKRAVEKGSGCKD